MNPEILVRSETNDEVGAIAEVTVAALQTLAISNHTELFTNEARRAADGERARSGDAAQRF